MPQHRPGVWYRAQAFAELAGVTVRTLHHYDRIGLLKPRLRSKNGYRWYRAEDLERIEQIVALKFLGLPLCEIRRLLAEEPDSLGEQLKRQQSALTDKRKLLDQALDAIADAQLAIHQGKPTAELLRRIIETIGMHNEQNWMLKYYSRTAQRKLAERAADFTPEMQAQIGEAWKQYYRDLAALTQESDPDGTRAAELEARRRELLRAFTGGDPEIDAGLTALYRDRNNWPAEMTELISEYETGPAQGGRKSDITT